METYRHYVSMITVCDRQGILTPLTLIWDDGKRYRIDAILERKESAVTDGQRALCYRCRIAGSQRSIFYAQARWFVETRYR